jgi:hypothetical protein
MDLTALFVTIIGVYVCIGLIHTMVAVLKSSRFDFYINDLKILGKIIIVWPWKYKSLANKLR